MKFTKKEFKQKVDLLYNSEIEVIGHFKGLTQPVLVKDKYGVMKLSQARNIIKSRPTIAIAINQTSYFMELLKDIQPNIANTIIPISNYETMNSNMMFKDKYGEISITPGNLLAGHCPNIRSSVDRKSYFKNMLLFLYDNKYDFKITNTDRHGGKSVLICPIHGEIIVDNDYLFQGKGCSKCNQAQSDIFYLVKLTNEIETFYKLGISHLINNKIKQYDNYKNLGYTIHEIKTIQFNDVFECKTFENKLKKIIKPYLFNPKIWEYQASTECFKEDLLNIILNSYINEDIV